MNFIRVALSLTALSVVALVACSSSSSDSSTASCTTNPFECPAGQTCAAKTTLGDYACLASGPGKVGDTCQNTPGNATCGDGLTCLQLTTAGGQCVSYCDPNGGSHGCGSGETCRAAALTNTTEQQVVYVCYKPASSADAG